MRHNGPYIVCPHCLYEDRDSWEVDFGGRETTEVSCIRCDKAFGVTQNITIRYESWPLDPEKHTPSASGGESKGEAK